jgi:hypothetical protein
MMEKAQQEYTRIGNSIKGAEESQMFGKPCFKTGGKAFVSFFNDCMVFKVQGVVLEKALSLKGSQLFDPSGKKRPMKEWVQVPFAHAAEWPKLARAAFKYVSSL